MPAKLTEEQKKVAEARRNNLRAAMTRARTQQEQEKSAELPKILSKNRAYSPQEYVLLLDLNSTDMDFATIKYGTTHGMQTCSAVAMFSPSTQKCVLHHFDDPFSISDTKSNASKDPNVQKQAKEYYRSVINNMTTLLHAENSSSIPNDIQVISVCSLDPASCKLRDEYIKPAIETIRPQRAEIIPPTKSDETMALPLQEIKTSSRLKAISYVETVQFSTLIDMTMTGALKLPLSSELFHVEKNGDLELQDKNGRYEFNKDGSVTPRPTSINRIAEQHKMLIEQEEYLERNVILGKDHLGKSETDARVKLYNQLKDDLVQQKGEINKQLLGVGITPPNSVQRHHLREELKSIDSMLEKFSGSRQTAQTSSTPKPVREEVGSKSPHQSQQSTKEQLERRKGQINRQLLGVGVTPPNSVQRHHLREELKLINSTLEEQSQQTLSRELFPQSTTANRTSASPEDHSKTTPPKIK